METKPRVLEVDGRESKAGPALGKGRLGHYLGPMFEGGGGLCNIILCVCVCVCIIKKKIKLMFIDMVKW